MQILEDDFREECQQEIRAELPDEHFDFDTLCADVNSVLVIDASLESKGYPEEATILEARLLDIARREKNRMRRADDWNEALKRKDA